MGTHPIFESDFDCLTAGKWRVQGQDRRSGDRIEKSAIAKKTANVKRKSGNGTRKKTRKSDGGDSKIQTAQTLFGALFSCLSPKTENDDKKPSVDRKTPTSNAKKPAPDVETPDVDIPIPDVDVPTPDVNVDVPIPAVNQDVTTP